MDPVTCKSTLVNPSSTCLYPDHVDKYIQEEVGFQAMLSPLDSKPFDIHISPFMTREKSDSISKVLRLYVWVYYLIPLTELCPFLITSYRKFVEYVRVDRIRE